MLIMYASSFRHNWCWSIAAYAKELSAEVWAAFGNGLLDLALQGVPSYVFGCYIFVLSFVFCVFCLHDRLQRRKEPVPWAFYVKWSRICQPYLLSCSPPTMMPGTMPLANCFFDTWIAEYALESMHASRDALERNLCKLCKLLVSRRPWVMPSNTFGKPGRCVFRQHGCHCWLFVRFSC